MQIFKLQESHFLLHQLVYILASNAHYDAYPWIQEMKPPYFSFFEIYIPKYDPIVLLTLKIWNRKIWTFLEPISYFFI